MTRDDEVERPLLPRAIGFTRHFYGFLAVAVVAIATNAAFDLGLPLFWPIAAWATALAVHFFVASSLDVREDWAEEKAEDLRMRSYDFGHVDEIRDRAARGEHSVTHPEEREKAKRD